jgi:hypothetical protein
LKEYKISAPELEKLIKKLKVKIPFGLLDRWYYYTDLEGWGEIIQKLSISKPHKEDRFDCDNIALEAMNDCAEIYGLNTLGMVIGKSPYGLHAFNMFYYGGGFKLFEPNRDYGYREYFEIGENGYSPQVILI